MIRTSISTALRLIRINLTYVSHIPFLNTRSVRHTNSHKVTLVLGRESDIMLNLQTSRASICYGNINKTST